MVGNITFQFTTGVGQTNLTITGGQYYLVALLTVELGVPQSMSRTQESENSIFTEIKT